MNDDTPISNAAESEHMKVHGQSTFNVIAACRQLEKLLGEMEALLLESDYSVHIKQDFYKPLTKLTNLRNEAMKGTTK